MKDVVKTMGLKGAIILLLIILMAPKVAQFNQMLEIACLAVGAVFLVLYLEAYINWLREGIVDSVISEISESKAFDEKLNELMREDLRNFSSQCMNEINATSQNCINVMNSCSEQLSFNVSEAKNNLVSTLVQEATKMQEHRSSIANDLVNEIGKTNKDIADKIKVTNEDAIVRLGNIVADRSEAVNAMVEQSRLALANNIDKVETAQVNRHQGLVQSLADSFTNVTEQFTTIKGRVEENIKGMVANAQKAEENREAIISAVNAYNEKLSNNVREDVTNYHNQCVDEIRIGLKNCADLVDTNTANIVECVANGNNSISSALARESEKAKVQQEQIGNSIINEIVKTSKDIADKIQVTNEDAITKLSEAISYRSDLTNGILEQTREAMIDSINNVAETQQNRHKVLTNTLTNSFVGVYDKLASLKGSMEETNEGVAEISKKVTNHGDSLVPDLKNYSETTNSMIKEVTDKVQSSLDISISKLDKIVADRNESINAAIEENKAAVMTNIAKLAEIQVNANKGLVESMADAFAGVDENLTLFRDCLEENLKAVAAVAPNANDNKEAIISAVNKHNAYLEKFQDRIKDKVKDIIEQETVEDYPNKATVISTKRNGILIQSEMRENNKLALMAGYDNGRMVFSKTFDEAGNLTSETVYGPYGQVKERRTYRPVNGNVKVEVEKF